MNDVIAMGRGGGGAKAAPKAKAAPAQADAAGGPVLNGTVNGKKGFQKGNKYGAGGARNHPAVKAAQKRHTAASKVARTHVKKGTALSKAGRAAIRDAAAAHRELQALRVEHGYQGTSATVAGPSEVRGGAMHGAKVALDDRQRAGGHVLVHADVARLDRSLAADPGGFHVGPGGKGPSAIKGRYDQARDFIAGAKDSGVAVHPPSVSIRPGGGASIDDGRHRFAALRDSGAETVPVAVHRTQAAAFAREFGPGAAEGKTPVQRRVAASAKEAGMHLADGAARKLADLKAGGDAEAIRLGVNRIARGATKDQLFAAAKAAGIEHAATTKKALVEYLRGHFAGGREKP